MNRAIKSFFHGFLAITLLLTGGCCAKQQGGKKIGVMVLSHGSPTPAWLKNMTDLSSGLEKRFNGDERIAGVKNCYMEVNEPSIAQTLKTFDEEGYTDVIVMPVFSAEGIHVLLDIPTLLGIRTDPGVVEELREEGFEIYRPRARVTYGPTLDCSGLYAENAMKRVPEESLKTKDEAILLVPYGSRQYLNQWKEVFDGVCSEIRKKTGKNSVDYSWFGYIVKFNPEGITAKIEEMLKTNKKVTVVPMVLSASEKYLGVIEEGVQAVSDPSRVNFRKTSVFPDPAIDDWAAETILEIAALLK